MKKVICLTIVIAILISILPVQAAHQEQLFPGLIGGKIDPNIGLLKDASITIVQQSGIIIEGPTDKKEEVWVEYKVDVPITGIPLIWDGHKSKVRKEEVDLNRLKDLAKNIDVLAIWNDPIAEPMTCSSDCSYGYSSYKIGELLTSTRVTELHTLGYTGKGVYVMVVDTGIDSSTNVNVFPELKKGIDYQSTKHGSKSASTIASKDLSYLGYAPDAVLIDCPAVNPANEYEILDCFQWAIDRYSQSGFPQIITNSWGYTAPISPSHATVRKIKEAVDKGIIVIMAATNCGSGCSSYGSCCDGYGNLVDEGCVEQDKFRGPGKSIHGPNQIQDVITVAAVDAKSKTREGYSSQGPSYNPDGSFYVANKPNIAGFADFVVAVGSSASAYAGTSAATPTVAGITALMVQANPMITSQKVRDILYSNAIISGSCSGDQYYDIGFGYFDAYHSVIEAADINTCGNGICDYGEYNSNCPSDCYCGNLRCEQGESFSVCPIDCKQQIICGDGKCEADETYISCRQDCPHPCDSMDCNDHNTCTQDSCSIINGLHGCFNSPISPCCGNGICELGEGVWICTADCDLWQCHENCDYTIQQGVEAKPGSECDAQCSEYCGDGVCGVIENYKTCLTDCPSPPSDLTPVYITVGVFILGVGSTILVIKRRKNANRSFKY